MRYLITGTAGFIGFHVARHFLDRGHQVVGVDGLTPYYDIELKKARHRALERSPNFHPVIGLIEAADTFERAATHGAPDVVIHLAAQAGVRYGLTNPGAYIDANVRGSWNVLEFARAHEPGHLMLASTSSVYGAPDKVPFEETDPSDEPLSLYAATKKAMEAMAHSYAHLHRIPTTAFRFFTVYGPWGRPDMALFKFADAIRTGRPIDVYGEGRMSRDFTYVDDLVEAIGRLAAVAPGEHNRVANDTLSHQAPFRVVNVGGGRPVDLLDFIGVLEEALGRKATRNMLAMQPGDVPRTFAATDLLQRLIGFVPATDIRTGVTAFVDWYLDHHGARTPD